MVKPFRIIAHRGASGYAPENTMAAFKRAVEMGCGEMETDVQFTKDRHLP
jgi:glycerophosphoryl diester phosphodiesterase